MSAAPRLAIVTDGEQLELRPSGSWTVANAAALESLVRDLEPQLSRAKNLTLDFAEMRELDTAGAWLLEKMSRRAGRPLAETVHGADERYAGLIDEMREVNRAPPPPRADGNPLTNLLETVGRGVFSLKDDLAAFLQILGELTGALARLVTKPLSFRLTSTVYQLYKVGWQAIPIMALITFLIGAIIAQQGIFHFRKFGAESYVVDMVGILVLRELGVLIVAIMMAGRSGSAYTAEIGSMKMREEIDALSTMGHDPIEVLVLPRVIALVIALPILAFIGAMAALYGGGLVAWLYGGMSPATFIERLHEAISVTHFKVGMIKAPFMALVIGIIATGEGLRVKGSAESLGRQTTTSVVKSIFVVIVLDGLFAVFFASIGM